jgi:hypothetical protein
MENEAFLQNRRPMLAENFGAHFSARELSSFAIEAVHIVSPGITTFQHNGQVFSQPMLLTVLTFCYASAIYASSDIERAILEDESVRYLCARVFPEAEDLRHFRRRNASIIKQCLVELFTIAARANRSGFPNTPQWMIAAEADRRVMLAIQADSIAMDT